MLQKPSFLRRLPKDDFKMSYKDVFTMDYPKRSKMPFLDKKWFTINEFFYEIRFEEMTFFYIRFGLLHNHRHSLKK